MRCFVAIDLDYGMRAALTRRLARLPRGDVRWATPEQLHVTLKFLGHVEPQRLPQVCDALRETTAELAPFVVRLGGLGCFPSAVMPRVLWCGVEDPEAGCRRWLEAAGPRFAELGFPTEERAFHPHVTLGRVRSQAGSRLVREVLDQAAGSEPAASGPPALRVEQLVLFGSRLLAGGARYAPLFSARLGG